MEAASEKLNSKALGLLETGASSLRNRVGVHLVRKLCDEACPSVRKHCILRIIISRVFHQFFCVEISIKHNFYTMNVYMLASRFDFFGIYIVMFLEILKTLVKVIIVFSLLVFAFGFSFLILLSPGVSDMYQNLVSHLLL